MTDSRAKRRARPTDSKRSPLPHFEVPSEGKLYDTIEEAALAGFRAASGYSYHPNSDVLGLEAAFTILRLGDKFTFAGITSGAERTVDVRLMFGALGAFLAGHPEFADAHIVGDGHNHGLDRVNKFGDPVFRSGNEDFSPADINSLAAEARRVGDPRFVSFLMTPTGAIKVSGIGGPTRTLRESVWGEGAMPRRNTTLFREMMRGAGPTTIGGRGDGSPARGTLPDASGNADGTGGNEKNSGSASPPERSATGDSVGGGPFLSNRREETRNEGGRTVTVTTWDGADGNTYQQKSWENADKTVSHTNIEKVEGEAKKDESAKEERSTKSEEKKDDEDINANQNTTYENPQEDGGDERPYKRVFIPTATDKFLLIAALRAAQEVNKRTPKPGTDTGWQPFGNGSVARVPEQSSGSYLPDAAAGQMMMASSYEGAGRSRFRSPATDGPDQVPLGAARQRDRSNGRGVMSWFRPNPDDPNPSPRPNARARQG